MCVCAVHAFDVAYNTVCGQETVFNLILFFFFAKKIPLRFLCECFCVARCSFICRSKDSEKCVVKTQSVCVCVCVQAIQMEICIKGSGSVHMNSNYGMHFSQRFVFICKMFLIVCVDRLLVFAFLHAYLNVTFSCHREIKKIYFYISNERKVEK